MMQLLRLYLVAVTHVHYHHIDMHNDNNNDSNVLELKYCINWINMHIYTSLSTTTSTTTTTNNKVSVQLMAVVLSVGNDILHIAPSAPLTGMVAVTAAAHTVNADRDSDDDSGTHAADTSNNNNNTSNTIRSYYQLWSSSLLQWIHTLFPSSNTTITNNTIILLLPVLSQFALSLCSQHSSITSSDDSDTTTTTTALLFTCNEYQQLSITLTRVLSTALFSTNANTTTSSATSMSPHHTAVEKALTYILRTSSSASFGDTVCEELLVRSLLRDYSDYCQLHAHTRTHTVRSNETETNENDDDQDHNNEDIVVDEASSVYMKKFITTNKTNYFSARLIAYLIHNIILYAQLHPNSNNNAEKTNHSNNTVAATASQSRLLKIMQLLHQQFVSLITQYLTSSNSNNSSSSKELLQLSLLIQYICHVHPAVRHVTAAEYEQLKSHVFQLSEQQQQQHDTNSEEKESVCMKVVQILSASTSHSGVTVSSVQQ